MGYCCCHAVVIHFSAMKLDRTQLVIEELHGRAELPIGDKRRNCFPGTV